MLSIHPQARTTPAVRREIARSHEPTGVLAARYGVVREEFGCALFSAGRDSRRGSRDWQRPGRCSGWSPAKALPAHRKKLLGRTSRGWLITAPLP